jgi:hypothetical protein
MSLDHAIHRIFSIVAGVIIPEELYLNESSYRLSKKISDFRVILPDRHGFDYDHDGIGCRNNNDN